MTTQALEALMTDGSTLTITQVCNEEIHQWQDLLLPDTPWVRVRTLEDERIINTAQIVSIKEVE